jgi:hypothetical protein
MEEQIVNIQEQRAEQESGPYSDYENDSQKDYGNYVV